MEAYFILVGLLVIIPGIFTLAFPSFRGLRWDPRLHLKHAGVQGRRDGDGDGVRGVADPSPITRDLDGIQRTGDRARR